MLQVLGVQVAAEFRDVLSLSALMDPHDLLLELVHLPAPLRIHRALPRYVVLALPLLDDGDRALDLALLCRALVLLDVLLLDDYVVAL